MVHCKPRQRSLLDIFYTLFKIANDYGHVLRFSELVQRFGPADMLFKRCTDSTYCQYETSLVIMLTQSDVEV